MEQQRIMFFCEYDFKGSLLGDTIAADDMR